MDIKYRKFLRLRLTTPLKMFYTKFSKLTWFLLISFFILLCCIPQNTTEFDFKYSCEEMIYSDQIDIWPQPSKWHGNMTAMGKLKLKHYALRVDMSVRFNSTPNLYFQAPKTYEPYRHMHQKIGGKGVVMLVSQSSFKMVYSNIIMMRNFSDISIELFHYDELKLAQEIVFGNMKNVNVVNLKDLVFVSQPIQYVENARNYQLKSASILASQFNEILFLDSDNLPVKDPVEFFDMPEYKKFGLVLWPDIWKTHPKNPIFNIFDKKCSNQWEIEAGQMLIHKEKHMKTLLMSYYIMQDRGFWFDLLFGDKDVMKYAADFVGLKYKVVPYFPSLVGYLDRFKGDKFFCGLVMLQNGFDGEPMFFHANQVKYRGNIGKDYFLTIQKYRYANNNMAQMPLLVTASNGNGCTALGERSGNKYTKLDHLVTDDILGDFLDNWLSLRKELLESWD
eukprot:NODE_713_length_4517_cov_0.967180.p1 type:complete len:448 gc:universal NODE_713_length_4517_cov_0.967180:2479-3822(+)